MIRRWIVVGDVVVREWVREGMMVVKELVARVEETGR